MEGNEKITVSNKQTNNTKNMNTIDAPITRGRRTKEEIAKADREKQNLKARLAKYIEDNYDTMSGAAINGNGFRVIAITIGLPTPLAPADSKAYLGIEYQPEAIRATDSFTLDDGQDSLFGPAGAPVGANTGATGSATAPVSPAPAVESAPAGNEAPAGKGKGAK